MEPVQLRRPRPVGHARAARRRSSRLDSTSAADIPIDRGMLAALDAIVAAYRARSSPTCRRCRAASWDISATTWSARSSTCPTRRRRSRAARRGDEHHRFAGGVRPLAPAGVPHRERPGARHRHRRLDARTTPPSSGCSRPSPSCSHRLPYAPVEPPPLDEELPEVHSSMSGGMYQQAVEVAKEHILAGDIFQVVLGPALRPRPQADPFDVYRVLRQVNPSPVHVLPAPPRLTIVGSSPEPMVQVLGRKVCQPADRRHPPPWPHRRARPPDGRRAEGASEGASPSTSCSSTSPATTSVGWPSSARCTSTS